MKSVEQHYQPELSAMTEILCLLKDGTTGHFEIGLMSAIFKNLVKDVVIVAEEQNLPFYLILPNFT